MSSHVVVLDSSARRAVIKTNPSKYLTDVLQEACVKLALDPTRHGLNKTLNLSQPFRLSGLSTGAKLQLVVLSRSPSVVSVALQLPESDGEEPSRLINKFPSTTTLWLILRRFESGAAGSNVPRNFTARGLPQVNGGESGPGRLFYETPVIHAIGRELVSFIDLQKTLAQLGYNDGSVLLRLSFRATQSPLEQAIMEIDQYFRSLEEEANGGSTPEMTQPTVANEGEDSSTLLEPPSRQLPASTFPGPTLLSPNAQFGASALVTDPAFDGTMTGPDQRPITVFAPPSGSTPAAARQAYNERDYEPSIDHARLHQSRLATNSRNKTLPSNAELAAQAEAQAKNKAEVKVVKIKTRFPDNSTVISEFSYVDTNWQLYEYVRKLLENEDEPFSLNFMTGKGPQKIAKESNTRLISGLGMIGSAVVNVLWEEGVSSQARAGRVLKREYQDRAAEIKVKEPEVMEVHDEKAIAFEQKESGKREVEKKGGVPKWLRLPSKK